VLHDAVEATVQISLCCGVSRWDGNAEIHQVLVAGASGGLGTALAVELARRGATLTLAARDNDRLAAVPVDAQRVTLDLRLPEACADAVEFAIAHAGRLDVVINAVGVVAFGNVADLSIDAMEELFLTNTFVPIMLASASISLASLLNRISREWQRTVLLRRQFDRSMRLLVVRRDEQRSG